MPPSEPTLMDTLLVALLASECRPIPCPVKRLQHAVSRVETLLVHSGFGETAKELRTLREAVQPPATIILPAADPVDADVLTGRRKRKEKVASGS